MPSNAIPKIALRWTPNQVDADEEDQRRHEEDHSNEKLRRMDYTDYLNWALVEHLPRNSGGWRCLVLALCAKP